MRESMVSQALCPICSVIEGQTTWFGPLYRPGSREDRTQRLTFFNIKQKEWLTKCDSNCWPMQELILWLTVSCYTYLKVCYNLLQAIIGNEQPLEDDQTTQISEEMPPPFPGSH